MWPRGVPRVNGNALCRARTDMLRTRGNGDAAMKQDIPGTIMFDGTQAQKGLALNRMCFSFNSAENRAAFVRDEDAYCRKFGLDEEQRAAVKSRNVLAMIEAGGNVYYLAKLAGIFGLNVQDIGAQQTGMTRRRVQGEARRSREVDHGTIIGGIAPPTFPRSARRSRRRSRTIPTGSRSSRASITCTLARAREAGRRGGVLQRPRPQLLSRQAADLRRRRGERIPQRGRRLGHPGVPLGPGRSGCPGI